MKSLKHFRHGLVCDSVALDWPAWITPESPHNKGRGIRVFWVWIEVEDQSSRNVVINQAAGEWGGSNCYILCLFALICPCTIFFFFVKWELYNKKGGEKIINTNLFLLLNIDTDPDGTNLTHDTNTIQKCGYSASVNLMTQDQLLFQLCAKYTPMEEHYISEKDSHQALSQE